MAPISLSIYSKETEEVFYGTEKKVIVQLAMTSGK
jgi:hypothetical protein